MTGELHNRKMKQNENKQNNKNQIIMKKHMILVAIATLTLASCAKIETINTNPVVDENIPISFTNYAPKAITKAATANYAESTTLVNNAEFDVYAWATANGTSFTGSNGVKSNGHDFMEWYTVTYRTGGNTNGATNAYPDGYRYWPSGDAPDYLSFYAYYPSNGTGITPPAAGLGAFSFTAQATAATMVDFMVADVVKDQVYDNTNSGTDGTVALTFRHMLTRVQFKFKTTQDVIDNGTTVTLTDVKLYNAKTTGTLTTSYNGTTTGAVWSAQATPSASPYEVFVNGADINNLELTATAAPATNNAADIFLMVPQAMVTNTGSNPQYLVVSWDVTTGGVTTHNTKTLNFKDDLKTTDNITAAAAAMNLDWAPNASITYTLTIGPKPILFTATVENWANETNGYFNVN